MADRITISPCSRPLQKKARGKLEKKEKKKRKPDLNDESR
jgi:hypothetical protein